MDGPCVPFVSDCAVRLATDLLAHRWDPVVLVTLRQGPRRRADLLAEAGGMSDKVLTEALRRLGHNGLVERERAPGGAVTYALTPLGRSLAEGPMVALGVWAAEHGEAVVAAQSRAAG